MACALQVEHLAKSYGDLVLFEDISFAIDEGRRVALIARNGAGKSTLLDIVAGRLTADAGSVVPRRDLRVAYLEQSPAYPAGTTVAEACFRSDAPAVQAIAAYERAAADPSGEGLQEAMARMDALEAWDYEKRAERILSRLEIRDLGQRIETLSGGQLKRVALANALIDEADLLILDEPTNRIKEIYKKYGYDPSASDCITRTTDMLFLFLDINGFLYSPEISFLWFESVESHFDDTVSLYAYRRALFLIAEQHRNGYVDIKTRFRNAPAAFSMLPEWCMKPADDFLYRKRREGLKDSTLMSYRSAVCRFCTYLCESGIHSFNDVTFSVIKTFNRQDGHRTPAGKNAYNGCIRKFLAYLGEQGLVDNSMLFAALSSTYAPRETIVVVLTDDELTQLYEQINRDDSSLTLRKKAMLLLGLKMGLRASDIVSLEIGSIDWKNPSIRFVQKKTGVEVNLPMPAEVGNALYQYITKERRQSPNPVIFLSEDAPFEPLDSTACIRALHSALPERSVPGSGFHVTRKTYATQLLRNGVGVDMVINALGQRGDDAVDRYLCVDDERMRLCPVSLLEYGIGGWSHEK